MTEMFIGNEEKLSDYKTSLEKTGTELQFNAAEVIENQYNFEVEQQRPRTVGQVSSNVTARRSYLFQNSNYESV